MHDHVTIAANTKAPLSYTIRFGYLLVMRIRPYAPNRNGWTPDRRAAFIAALRVHRSVTAAVAAVAMTREAAYWLRRQPEAAEFRDQWEATLAFVINDAVYDAEDFCAPEAWSTRRLVRALKRLTERETRATAPKISTS